MKLYPCAGLVMTILVLSAGFGVSAIHGRLHDEKTDSISSLSWLSGIWMETRSDGELVEEYWSEPAKGFLFGAARSVHADGTKVTHELSAVTLEGDTIVLRGRSFDSDLRCKETEPRTMKSTGRTEKSITFEFSDETKTIITKYSREGDKLTIDVEVKRDGASRSVSFKLSRKK